MHEMPDSGCHADPGPVRLAALAVLVPMLQPAVQCPRTRETLGVFNAEHWEKSALRGLALATGAHGRGAVGCTAGAIQLHHLYLYCS